MRRRPLSESRPWRLLRVRGGLRVLRLVGSVVVLSVLPGVVLSAVRYELLLLHHLLVLLQPCRYSEPLLLAQQLPDGLGRRKLTRERRTGFRV